MGSKLFSAALEDCLAAQAIQSRDKSSGGGIQSKTYLRTAKCQLALGLIGPSQQSLQEAFRLEPSNRAIITEKSKADRIAGHVERLKENLDKKDWSMVLLGVDAAVRELGEGGSSPREWRGWKVEALVGKKRYDEAAGLAA
jgi:DnaJ family protein C protein 7